MGMVYAGMGPDYRVLVTEARKAASVYSAKYGEPIPTEQLVMSLATVMQVNTVTHLTYKLIRNLFFVASMFFRVTLKWEGSGHLVVPYW